MPARAPAVGDGLYLYCIVQGAEVSGPGAAGLDGNEVFPVPCQDLCVLVHCCPPRPYQSTDQGMAAAWVLAHHQVVESAWRRWGTVLPLAFNTIIKGEDDGSALENLEAWLERERSPLTTKLARLRGKEEYGIQVSWDLGVIGRECSQRSAEIRALEQEIGSKPRGLAYMYRQKLERVLRVEMEAMARDECASLYETIGRCADGVRVERAREEGQGRHMLLNLSCLMPQERVPELRKALESVERREGYSVRLAGPFPPYSFC